MGVLEFTKAPSAGGLEPGLEFETGLESIFLDGRDFRCSVIFQKRLFFHVFVLKKRGNKSKQKTQKQKQTNKQTQI